MTRLWRMFNKTKTPQEIEAMRQGGQILAQILSELKDRVVPGINTKDLADYAAGRLHDFGAEPVTLGYHGFPDVLCVSVNNEVVHGIPKSTHILKEGDIVSLDFVVKYKGMITDAAVSVVAGKASPKIQRFIDTTEAALMHGISAITGSVRVGDIANAVEKTLRQAGYGVVEDLVGHGVGHEMHEEPNIPNYGMKGSGPLLKPGMTIAIEPMATLGSHRVYCDSDGWTIKTVDASLAAHFEHTILITEDGAEILTRL